MICIGGLRFDVSSSTGSLDATEEQLIADFARLRVPPIDAAPVSLRLYDEGPWKPSGDQRAALGNPAALGSSGDVIRVAHADFAGEFDVVSRCGSYARDVVSPAPLRIMLRAAFAASLPDAGGVPFHAAALVHGQNTWVFFGESGAGKSTVAAVSQLPVISDEIVSLTVEDGRVFVRATGFGDELGRDPVVLAPAPVTALVQLAKGERFDVQLLPREEALPQFLKAVLSPAHPDVWRSALTVTGELVRSGIPIVRMSWSPERSPVRALAEALAC